MRMRAVRQGISRGAFNVLNIEYKVNHPISSAEFIELLKRSSLGERRPIQDLDCIEGMLAHSNLLVTAWQGERLVGVARSLTDFHYACYLSDLAVDQAYQCQGIGKHLQSLTQAQLGPRAKLILIAAPAAQSYYGHLGYSANPRCWVLEPGVSISPAEA